MPNGSPAETTELEGWYSDISAGWRQTLQSDPSGWNFGGRYVTEEDGGGGSDSCWFEGSAVPLSNVIGEGVNDYEGYSGTWNVDAISGWGYDYVGWPQASVTYYRDQGSAPCSMQLTQVMYIGCSDSPYSRTYITNSLEFDIASTSVTSKRAGQSGTNTTW